MTNEELSLKIAESLEPRRVLTSIGAADFDRGVIDEKVISALGCWYFIRDEEPVWRPRDFVGNPAMTILLMKRLLIMGFLNFEKYLDHFKLITPSGKSGTLQIEDLGRAIAEAYAKAEGCI